MHGPSNDQLITRGEHGPTLYAEGPDEMRARVAQVTARLAAHRLALPPGRFERSLMLFERFAAKKLSPAIPGFRRDLQELLEGNRDFAELATIVECLVPGAPPADPVLLAKFEHVLGGAPLPSEDIKSLARDTQFELYIAALCARGGLAPEFREPDCVITAAGLQLGVAAKRVRNPEHVRRHLRKGARQLRRAGLFGVVALSLDRLLAPNDERIVGQSAEDLKPAAPQIVHATVRPHVEALDRYAAGTPVLAVLASVVVVAAVPRHNSIGRVGGVFVHGFPGLTRPQYDALMHIADSLKRPPEV